MHRVCYEHKPYLKKVRGVVGYEADMLCAAYLITQYGKVQESSSDTRALA
jgi:hypothetical protein